MEELKQDQNIWSIRKNGAVLSYVESKEGKLVTSGIIGENEYTSLIEFIRGISGFGIEIDNFYT